MQVSTASKNTEDALALLKAERESHAEERAHLAGEIGRLTGELAATRRDRQHDQEALRQLRVANEALLDEVEAERCKCADTARERDRLIELCRERGVSP